MGFIDYVAEYFRGPAGEQGPQGEPGPQGDPGPVGPSLEVTTFTREFVDNGHGGGPQYNPTFELYAPAGHEVKGHVILGPKADFVALNVSPLTEGVHTVGVVINYNYGTQQFQTPHATEVLEIVLFHSPITE